MKKLSLVLLILIVSGSVFHLFAQPEVMAWGNLTGIRVDGQLLEFESSLRVVEKGWNSFTGTGKERQRPKYDRDGDKQTVTTEIRGIKFNQVVEECGKGCALIRVNTSSEKDTIVEGVFLCIDLPGIIYSDANLHFVGASGVSKISKASISSQNNGKPLKIRSKGFIVESAERKIEVVFGSTAAVFLRKENNDNSTQIYIELMGQKIRKGSKVQNTFTVRASGTIDDSSAEIVLTANKPGRKFDGLGGNFRLQNPKTDPPVIDYCLENLRVAWGRVEMPWNFWHPDEDVDPIKAANAGKLNPRVDAAMKMAQRLTAIGIPVIISAWSAPNWAILGDPRDAFRLRSKGIYGYQLNPEKTAKIYRSIGDYVEYLKNYYGVEAVAFSFNESDLGINVRHTGKEHAEFIKGMGAHLESRGLVTKLLLGDNSDATTFDFIVPALNDPETHKYILAVSFHSWRGCDDETLKRWAEAAQKLNLPLIVAEGSTDAAAWNYPEIFSEQTFAFYEINLYTRILAISQPLSILQWQLTADYSLLTGQGIFGTSGPLKPTQRFWNLKQLASTPEGAFAIPLTCSKSLVNCAAFGNLSRNEFAIHMVNNGAECKAVVKGIPEGVTSFEIYVTDKEKEMEKTGHVRVVNGTAEFMLYPAAFTSLISSR